MTAQLVCTSVEWLRLVSGGVELPASVTLTTPPGSLRDGGPLRGEWQLENEWCAPNEYGFVGASFGVGEFDKTHDRINALILEELQGRWPGIAFTVASVQPYIP